MLDLLHEINQYIFSNNYFIIVFINTFLSASILPLASEIIYSSVIISLYENNEYINIYLLCMIAVLGNTLGSMTSYLIGRFVAKNIYKSKLNQYVHAKIIKYGYVALLFSWLPLIGDIFPLLAGWLKLNFVHCSFYIFFGKFLRFVLLTIIILYFS